MSPQSHSADRNLLFGIIALQLDFITRDQLIAAMNAWVLEKHKPLGQVLCGQGALSPEDQEAMESLVRRHLLRHDNDPERSLAALSSIGRRLRDDRSRVADPDVQASLPRVSAARGETESTLTYLGTPTEPGGRFRILRPHAQGGLGIVSVALDEELHREVALKEIQDRYATEEQARLRFLLEAEITGGLEHPGVVLVYGLGATLYAVLTGKAPFEGNDAALVLPKVQRGDFIRPRGVDPSIPRPLEAICVKAMALAQADRYATPRLLAEDVEHWLADEPVSAHREPWPDRARRWSRQHRTLVTSAAAVLLLAVISSAGFAAVVTAKNRELGRQTQRAEAREKLAIDAVKRFRDAVVEEPMLKNSPALEALRKTLLKEPLAFFGLLRAQLQGDHDTRPEALVRLAEAAHDYAHVSQEIGDIQDSLRSHLESLAIFEKLAREQPAKTDYQSGLATVEYCRANMLSATGHPDQALESYGKALAIRERLARENPSVTKFQSNLALCHNNIGNLQRATGHPDQALESYVKALAIQERLAREYPRVTEFQSSLAKSHYNVALLQSATGHPDHALESFAKAVAIQERLARENPSVTAFQRGPALSHNNFGVLQSVAGHPDQALESYRKALAIQERLARENPSVTAFQSMPAASHNNIAELQSAAGHPDQALESLAKALAIRERLAREHPDAPEYASDLGAALNNTATIDLAAKRLEQARDRLRQAISWQKKALAANPRHPTYRQFLRNHLTNLIRAAKALGNDAEASAAQRDLDELAANDPAKVALEEHLAAVLGGEPPRDNGERLQLAYRAYEKRLFAGSARLYAEALQIDPKLADDREGEHRYNAACAAALAAGARSTPTLPSPIKGEEKAKSSSPLVGEDKGGGAEKPLTGAERTKFRSQARAWLEAELAVWTELLGSASAQQRQAIAETLKHWQQDTDLAGIRDEAALAQLPLAERDACKSLWAKVDALLIRARTP